MTESYGLIAWLLAGMQIKQLLKKLEDFGASLDKIKQVVNVTDGETMFGLNIVVHKAKTIFVADTSSNEYPTSEQMAETVPLARVVRLFGFEPKVAFVSHPHLTSLKQVELNI